MRIHLPAVLLLTLGVPGVNAQQPSPAGSPAQESPATHFDRVNQRGDQAMGFSHKMTGHHFHLLPDGGAFEVEANNPKDIASQAAIRKHMVDIATMFSNGDFSLPIFIHATEPPGVKTMQRLKGEIAYSVENTDLGAQVRIKTQNPEALKAIHEFLRFQIADHRTGDSPEIQPDRSDSRQ